MTASVFPPIRFRPLPRWAAAAALVLLLAAIGAGLFWGVATPRYMRPANPQLGGGDGALYARIIADVARGEPYYRAAVREQRRFAYTLKPAWTVRAPLLAEAMSRLPGLPARRLALLGLMVLVWAAWGVRLQTLYGKPAFTAWGVFCLACGALFGISDMAYLFHECWAGLLIALSLAAYDARRWPLSVLIGLVAVLLRELAAPYLLVMAIFALCARRKGEACAWGAALAAFVVFQFWHAHQVAMLLQPGDLTSRGWWGLGGWPYVLLLAKWNALLVAAPDWGAAVLVPAMLLGAAFWPGGVGGRLAVLTMGYSAGFLVFGRLDTSYWGLIDGPLLGLSLAVAPQAIAHLIRSLSGETRGTTHP